MPSTAIRPKHTVSFVDLFSGVGGFTLGFMDNSSEPRVEFVPRLLVDIDNSARQVFIRNYPHIPFIGADIHALCAADIKARGRLGGEERLDVLIGGPPCQGFSFLGKRALDDERNLHVLDFLRLAKELRPRVVLMENVPLIITNFDGAVIKEVCEALSSFGYASCADVLMASEYGVPQIRRRAFVLAYHKDLGIVPELPKRTHERVPSAVELTTATIQKPFEPDKKPYVCVEDAIGDLPSLTAGQGEDVVMYPANARELTPFQIWSRSESIAIFNHKSRAHSASYLKKISVIQEGGSNQDLPDHQRFSNNYFSQAYARLDRNGLANTITTSFGNPGSGRFIHYRDLRSISVREAARLQSFRDTFVFDGDATAQMRHVGNAVPPLLARAIRDQIARDLLLSKEDKVGLLKVIEKPKAKTHSRQSESQAQRSKTMRAVPSENTSAERALRSALSNAGIRGYRLNCKAVPGAPDIVFGRERLAVFVDGCFWHGCPKCYRKPKANKVYWQMKVRRNRERDKEVRKQCKADGWRILRIWEHEITKSPLRVTSKVKNLLSVTRKPKRMVSPKQH